MEIVKPKLYFAKVRESAVIPTREKGNAGYDVYCNLEGYKNSKGVEKNGIFIPPFKTVAVPSGIAAAFDNDEYYLQVHERGSTGLKGLKYSAGVSDPNYRGEVFIEIYNANSDTSILFMNPNDRFELTHLGIYIESGDKPEVEDISGFVEHPEKLMNRYILVWPTNKAIAQLVIHKLHEADEVEISYDELKAIPSNRGTGALGSSGK